MANENAFSYYITAGTYSQAGWLISSKAQTTNLPKAHSSGRNWVRL